MYKYILHLSKDVNEKKIPIEELEELSAGFNMESLIRNEDSNYLKDFEPEFTYYEYGDIDLENKTITFAEDLKEAYFRGRYEALKNFVEDLTFNDFSESSSDIRFIKSLVDDEFSTYIYFYGSLMQLDDFIRYYSNVPGNIYNVIDVVLYR